MALAGGLHRANPLCTAAVELQALAHAAANLGEPRHGVVTITAAELVQQQQNRVEFLDQLYLLDGRDDTSHPLHARYTGLAQEFCYQIGLMFMRDCMNSFHDPEIRNSLAVAHSESADG